MRRPCLLAKWPTAGIRRRWGLSKEENPWGAEACVGRKCGGPRPRAWTGVSCRKSARGSTVRPLKRKQSWARSGEAEEPPPAAEEKKSAARPFNSQMRLAVWVKVGADKKELGQTPVATPLAIPEGAVWWVVPLLPVEMEALAREIAYQQISGLRLKEATDQDLAQLKKLTGLRTLDLTATHVTDAGLAHLKELQGLLTLDLLVTQVTDAGLAHLSQLKRLQTLQLGGTKVTDAGLAALTKLKGLQALYLDVTKVTDAGLAALTELKGLQTLPLAGTQVTDAGLAHLGDLRP